MTESYGKNGLTQVVSRLASIHIVHIQKCRSHLQGGTVSYARP
jgi:hypothetical protein